MEVVDRLIYKGVEFVFDACANIQDVAAKLEAAGECPGIMNAAYDKKYQQDGSVLYTFVNGEGSDG